MTNDVQNRFAQAAQSVSSGKLGSLSQDDRLELYALFSVVNKGEAPEHGPSAFLDPVGFAKWTAWATMSGLGKVEAMQQYITTVDRLSKLSPRDINNGDAVNNSGGFGNTFSTGFDLGVEVDNIAEAGSSTQWDLRHWSAIGDVKQVYKCVRWGQVAVNSRGKDGLTALMWAADRGHLEVADILISVGADLNATDGDGQTALHYAAYCDHAEMAGALVNHGASIDISDSDGLTPLQAATGATRAAIENASAGVFIRTTPVCQIPRVSLARLAQRIAPDAPSRVVQFTAYTAASAAALILLKYYFRSNRK